MKSNEPKEELLKWLESYGIEGELSPLTGDASFRQYYRIDDGFQKGIVMDASTQPESVVPFVNIAHRLHEAGVRTPKINAFEPTLGFVFMEDLGGRHMADVIDAEGESVYTKAIDMIVKMQYADITGLPAYDKDFLLFEMELMNQWYLDRYLQILISKEDRQIIDETLHFIADEVLRQPQGIFVHRDFHSRNIMIDPQERLAVIDFQDARVGAVTYDLVSLLRDVYVELPQAQVKKLALYFRDAKGLNADDETFMRWFDFMGLQRHIKILGIFARLALRDGKEGYLKDIPLTLKYVTEVAQKYEETRELGKILENIS